MKKISILLIIIFLAGISFEAFAAAKCPFKGIKLKKSRKKEKIEESKQYYDDILYALKYKVDSWDAKSANLNIYICRKKRDTLTTYKMTKVLEGKDIEKGNNEKIIAKDYEEEDKKYTRDKHGKIKRIRVELWYPAYGGKMIQAIESPNAADSDLPVTTSKSGKKKLAWWEKIEYGEYY